MSMLLFQRHMKPCSFGIYACKGNKIFGMSQPSIANIQFDV